MSEPEVLAFDLYGTLVDPIGISASLAAMTDTATGSRIASLWRQRQLEYAFRLAAMRRYQDFRWVTERALDDALTVLAVELNATERSSLIDGYDNLQPFPDVKSGLEQLAVQHRLVVLSNGSPAMIAACLANSGLSSLVESYVSVDEVRTFKPAPAVYEHASARIGRPIGDIRLVSSNPFDVIGSKVAGMRNAWVDRAGGVFDSIGPLPDIHVADLGGLGRAMVARD